jgi:hypothetical protein
MSFSSDVPVEDATEVEALPRQASTTGSAASPRQQMSGEVGLFRGGER